MPQQSAYGGGVGATYGGFDPRFASPYGATRGMPAQLIPGGSGAEDWYFVEMHASSLHESSQQRP